MGDEQAIDHLITYSVISSTPPLSYTSVMSTIRCYAVTSGKHEAQTFVQWTGNFSSDADAGKCVFFFLLGVLGWVCMMDLGEWGSGVGIGQDVGANPNIQGSLRMRDSSVGRPWWIWQKRWRGNRIVM